jgi:hypothetical protein
VSGEIRLERREDVVGLCGEVMSGETARNVAGDEVDRGIVIQRAMKSLPSSVVRTEGSGESGR